MKRSLKIILITLIVVAFVVALAYFIFFAEDRNHSVYKNVRNAMLYRYNIDFDNEIAEFYELGYNNDTSQITEEDYPTIYLLRQRMFSSDDTKIQGGSNDGTIFYYYSYAMYDSIIAEGIRYYSNYAALADSASKSAVNSVGAKIDAYKDRMTQLYNELEDVSSMQKDFGSEVSTITKESMSNAYINLRTLYRNHLLAESDLLLSLRDFIIAESFDNNYYFETVAMLYDSIAGTINAAMNDEEDQEINYLHDAAIYTDIYQNYISGNAINYGVVDEIAYLQAYTKLYIDSRKDYDLIFDFTHFQKQDLLHGDKGISSKIEVGYEELAIVILSILGL